MYYEYEQKSLFDRFKEFVNSNNVFSRQDLLNELGRDYETTIDVYRRQLTITEHIEVVSRGQYKRKNKIVTAFNSYDLQIIVEDIRSKQPISRFGWLVPHLT